MADRVEARGLHTSLADRKQRAGQRILMGFAGQAVDDDLRRLVRELQPAGFVLFRRNVADPAQVLELNRELASLLPVDAPAILAVDQEGGRVQRVKEPATVWPAMRTVGRAGTSTGDVSRAMARELRAMGFNLNFAPVADVDSNPANPIIGDRSFGDRPETVSEHVIAFLRAHQDEGIIACAKHFPGHGDTDQDSHLHLPVVERDERDLRHVELPPFAAAVAAGVGTVMTAHVLYPAWDEERPATMSPRIIRRLLREEMGFEGVVFSDDMEMKAVRGRYAIRDQVREASAATVDVFLCCERADVQVEVFQELVRAQEEDRAQEQYATDAARRVHALRERFFLHSPRVPSMDVVGHHAHRSLADLVRDRGQA